jgi:hypothetical protein
MAPLIVIPTHRSGFHMLENLLASLGRQLPYGILVVINDCREEDITALRAILGRHPALQVDVASQAQNTFELGGLAVALATTNADEFFLLSHSCELVDTGLFDILFQEHAGKSVALSLMDGDWRRALGRRRKYEPLVLRYLDRRAHDRLLEIGLLKIIPSLLGKYRRAVLERMDLATYLPSNLIEAISKHEMLFSYDYLRLDPQTVTLFPDFVDGADGAEIRWKFGKPRMRIANSYIIKWKSHWSPRMIYDELTGKPVRWRTAWMISRVRQKLSKILAYAGFVPTRGEQAVAKQLPPRQG